MNTGASNKARQSIFMISPSRHVDQQDSCRHAGGREQEARRQRIAEEQHAKEHAEDRRQEREQFIIRPTTPALQQPEPREIAGESDDDALIGQRQQHRWRQRIARERCQVREQRRKR